MLFRTISPKHEEEGFTLIELLVVIIIIGILAAIAIPLFLDQRKLAVDASVKADVRNTLANINTWQANGNANKAEASADAYKTDGGKLSQSPNNIIGVSISATGDATVCAYNTGGKTYTSASTSGSVGAYVYNPSTGQFTTGSCVGGSTEGGNPNSVAIGTYGFEPGDATNSQWTAGTITTAQAYAGTQSISAPYTGASHSSALLASNPATVAGKSYTVTGYAYTTSTRTNDTVSAVIPYVFGGPQIDGTTLVPNQWVPFSLTFTAPNDKGIALFGYNANGTNATTVYFDNVTLTRNN